MPLAWVTILIPEREKERGREKKRESDRLSFYAFNVLGSPFSVDLGNSIICKINVCFYLNSLT